MDSDYLLFVVVQLIMSSSLNKINSAPIEIIKGLNNRLNYFNTCNIILRSLDFDDTWLEPLTVPVQLDVLLDEQKVLGTNVSRTSMIKYRNKPCSLDIYILSKWETPSNYTGAFIEKGFDHANPSFLIFLMHLDRFELERRGDLEWLHNPKVLLKLMLFVWTVKPVPAESNPSVAVYEFDRQRFYLCQYCQSKFDSIVKHRVFEFKFEDGTQLSRQHEMDDFVKEQRRNIAWNMDDRIRCNCLLERSRYEGIIPFISLKSKLPDSEWTFSSFMTDLISRRNVSSSRKRQMAVDTDFYNYFDLPNFCFRGTVDVTYDIYNEFLSIPVGEIGYNFITCHKVEQENYWKPIQIFIQPFQAVGWFLILETFTLLSFYLAFKKALRMYPDRISEVMIPMMLYLNEVPAGRKLLQILHKDNTLKMLISLWMLCAFILANWFKSVNTALDSKPIEPIQWKKFLEMKNFDFFITENLRKLPESCGRNETKADNPNDQFFDTAFEYHLSQLWETGFEEYKPIFAQHNLRKMNQIDIVEQIKSCTRSAYISFRNNVDNLLLELNEQITDSSHTYYKGNENFIPQSINWVFKDIPESQPLIQLSRLQESGIYGFWKYWLQDRPIEMASRIQSKAQEAHSYSLSLKSEIRYIFYLLLALYLVAVIVFLLEHLLFAHANGKLQFWHQNKVRTEAIQSRLSTGIDEIMQRNPNQQYPPTSTIPTNYSRSFMTSRLTHISTNINKTAPATAINVECSFQLSVPVDVEKLTVSKNTRRQQAAEGKAPELQLFQINPSTPTKSPAKRDFKSTTTGNQTSTPLRNLKPTLMPAIEIEPATQKLAVPTMTTTVQQIEHSTASPRLWMENRIGDNIESTWSPLDLSNIYRPRFDFLASGVGPARSNLRRTANIEQRGAGANSYSSGN